MLPHFVKSGSVALALWLSSGFLTSAQAQHHGGGGGHHGGGSMHHGGGGGYGGSSHHHHSSGGLYIGGGGIGFSYGTGYPYGGGYGFSNGPRYSSGYRGGYYDVSPSYRTGVYITPQYMNPAPTYIYQSPPSSVIYQTPSVQPVPVVARPPQSSGQRTSLPGVTFGERAHLNELAAAVAERTNLLCVSLHESYSGNAQFKEVYRDTYMLITAARQLTEKSSDPQATLEIVSDMNAILASVTPVIESWSPTASSNGSASGHLSGVTSAVKLLSVDAGWDSSRAVRGTSAPAPGTSSAPPAPVAPAPDLSNIASEPTPIDDAPVPAP